MPKNHRNDNVWVVAFRGSDPFLICKVEVWAKDINEAIKQVETHCPCHAIISAGVRT